MGGQRLPSDSSFGATLVVGAGLALASVVTLTAVAWISDDSLITLQQVKMFVAGEGIVWNPGIRVQAFTHPLWFFLLSAAHGVAGAFFWPTLILSIAFTTAAVLLLYAYCLRQPFARGNSLIAGPFAAMALLCAAFTDFGASGLENPLSSLLVACILWMCADPFRPGRQLMLIWLALAAMVLTRLDHAVLFLPLALWLGVGTLRAGRLGAIAPGVAVLLAWHAFATFYFGSPFPNTFYAKMDAGVPLDRILTQGVAYYIDIVRFEPVTLITILVGVMLGLKGDAVSRFTALGVALYLIYIVHIGGDFMRGRFFATPFFVSLFLIAGGLNLLVGRKSLIIGLGVLILGAFLYPHAMSTHKGPKELHLGIADERRYYFEQAGLLSPTRLWATPAPAAPPADIDTVLVGCGPAGEWRFEAPSNAVIVDNCGLGDPFMARLPSYQGAFQRIGHRRRLAPANYGEVLAGREQALSGGHGQALYEDLMLAATGSLFTPGRVDAILRLVTGVHSSSLKAFEDGAADQTLLLFENPGIAVWKRF